MQNPDKLMIEAQARNITTLRDNLRTANKKVQVLSQELSKVRRSGLFYNKMQEAILESSFLQGEWTRFCSFLRMAASDIETEFNAIESDDEDDYVERLIKNA